MRLFLLPISTRRSLIYCERISSSSSSSSTKPAGKRPLLERITTKASETWVAWEKDEKAPLAWKKKVTHYGNHALARIPYEEWGLKTIPALTARRRKAIEDGSEKYHITFPGLYLPQDKIPAVLKQLARERQAMHRRKMIWSVVAMPFSAPFMLIPVYALFSTLLTIPSSLLTKQDPQPSILLPRLPRLVSLESPQRFQNPRVPPRP